MKKSHLVDKVLVSIVLILVSATSSAVTVGPELISDPDFDNPASWNIWPGSSIVNNGHLVVINHSGFIFPEPRLGTEAGTTYQYELTVDLVNNTSDSGKVTVGGQTIWEPSYDIGIFTGTIVASDTGGLVFNFLNVYLGWAEFDSVSVKALIATPIPATLWLFGSGLLGLIGMARKKASK